MHLLLITCCERICIDGKCLEAFSKINKDREAGFIKRLRLEEEKKMLLIDHDLVERIKSEVDLPKMIEESQVVLRHYSNGTYQGLCPFHDDKNPSLSVSKKNNKWVWHCFGCRQKGTIFDWVIQKEGRTFAQAYEYLVERYTGAAHQDHRLKTPSTWFDFAHHKLLRAGADHRPASSETSAEENLNAKLLNNVMSYYESVFKRNREAQEYLKSRGLTNPEIYGHFRMGYSDGTLPIKTKDQWNQAADLEKELKDNELVRGLREYGLINQNDVEVFRGMAVFGIEDIDENIVGLYGRKIQEESPTDHRQSTIDHRPASACALAEKAILKHRYLKGKHRGCFNAKAFKCSQKIYITESIIDALSLYQIGIREVTSLFGTNGLTEDHLKYMRDYMAKEVVLCLDNDLAGEEATKRISEKLSSELGIKCSKLELPQGIKDINQWLLHGMSKEEVEKNISGIQIQEAQEENLSALRSALNANYDPDKDITFNFNTTLPHRNYRLRALELKRIGSFKANVKLDTEQGSHLDTFDLNSSNARENFKKMAKKLLNLEDKVIHQDLIRIIEALEEMQEKYLQTKDQRQKAEDNIHMMNAQEKEQALNLLKSPDLLSRIVEDLHKCGYVGEDLNLLTGYLTATSRKLRTPLGLYIISRSGSGKSALANVILNFIPEEDYKKFTRMTEQALFYVGEHELEHKLIAIEEERGARGADYSLRAILNDNLHNLVPIKDPRTGEIKTQEIKVKGPASQIITTTQTQIDHETYNRYIVTTIDESISQTKKILEYQRKIRGKDSVKIREEKSGICRTHQNAQRLIRRLRVDNPYSESLTFTDKILTARRENPKYHSLIDTICLLRQYQKEIKHDKTGDYIEVELEDIRLANQIARQILIHGLEKLTPPAKKLLSLVKELVRSACARQKLESYDYIITRRILTDYTGWNNYQIIKGLEELEAHEYIQTAMGKHTKKGVIKGYRLMIELDFNESQIDLGLKDL